MPFEQAVLDHNEGKVEASLSLCQNLKSDRGLQAMKQRMIINSLLNFPNKNKLNEDDSNIIKKAKN